MEAHQLIFTSCRCGIEGLEGQQIYSHDKDFPREETDIYNAMLNYRHPQLPSGIQESEETAGKMPCTFRYKRENGRQWLSCSTYLGRDYMGDKGRFGNFLTHVVCIDKGALPELPCNYVESPSFRRMMTAEETNCPTPPELLPLLSLETTDLRSDVLNFLQQDGRADDFKKLLAFFLSSDRRISIQDTPENILRWIAALEYVLPHSMAAEVSFSTYEYDPEDTDYQIVGQVILDESRTATSSYHYTLFDFQHGRLPEVEAKLDPDFEALLDLALMYSFGCMDSFGEFVDKYCVKKIKPVQLYTLYKVFQFYQNGRENLSVREMQDILHFMREYFPSQIYEQVLASILADVDEHPMPQQDSIAFLQFLLAEWQDMTAAGQKNCCRIIELLWSRDECKLSAYSIEHLRQAYHLMVVYDRRKTAGEMMQVALYQLDKPEEAIELIADFWKICLHNRDDMREYAVDMLTALHTQFPAEKKVREYILELACTNHITFFAADEMTQKQQVVFWCEWLKMLTAEKVANIEYISQVLVLMAASIDIETAKELKKSFRRLAKKWPQVVPQVEQNISKDKETTEVWTILYDGLKSKSVLANICSIFKRRP